MTSHTLIGSSEPVPDAHQEPQHVADAGDAQRALAGSDTPLALDLCGELCPFTFVRAKLALEELPIGAVLRVVVDHEPATRNIPRSATEWGQEVIAVTSLSSHTWAIDLRKRVR